MDEIRDIQKTDSISRFIDSHIVRTSPFGENRAGERAYRRAERIATALHLLTNHIDAKEPVAAAIRSEAVALLRHMLDLRSAMRSPRSELFSEVQARIRHAISLVRILTASGYISMQNATTMVEALDELGNFMTAAQRSALSESVSVTREDLLDVRPVVTASKKFIKDITDINITKETTSNKDSQTTSISSHGTVGQVTVREQGILDTLRGGGLMAIKDISSNLPEYSEKMIQRELSDMVLAGKVRKIGLKRWSRYALV